MGGVFMCMKPSITLIFDKSTVVSRGRSIAKKCNAFLNRSSLQSAKPSVVRLWRIDVGHRMEKEGNIAATSEGAAFANSVSADSCTPRVFPSFQSNRLRWQRVRIGAGCCRYANALGMQSPLKDVMESSAQWSMCSRARLSTQSHASKTTLVESEGILALNRTGALLLRMSLVWPRANEQKNSVQLRPRMSMFDHITQGTLIPGTNGIS